MKKFAIVFILGIMIPSLILGGLLLHSLRNQEMVIKSQQASLCQLITEGVASEVNAFINDIQIEFRETVDDLLVEEKPAKLAKNFDALCCADWNLAQVGYITSTDGELISPSPSDDPRIIQFNEIHEKFLTNRETAEVFGNVFNDIANVSWESQYQLQPSEEDNNTFYPRSSTRGGTKQQLATQNYELNVLTQNHNSRQPLEDVVASKSRKQVKRRVVIPEQVVRQTVQSQSEQPNLNPSKIEASETAFLDIIGEGKEGFISRFQDNRLHILIWYRPEQRNDWVFGAQFDLKELHAVLGHLLNGSKVKSTFAPSKGEKICLALIDDLGVPFAQDVPGFVANAWSKPFVASEIGESLPHWEVAAYMVNPGSMNQTARNIRYAVSILVLLMMAAIGLGGVLIFSDLRRQLELAKKKTDFVSNVSHELKTPLTSIQMFSDLLTKPEVPAQKSRHYGAIISTESARLSRLINNVLDFSSMERREKKFRFETVDLVSICEDLFSHYQPQIESQGYEFSVHKNVDALPVRADKDGVSQIMLNLISNAEKYGGEAKNIRIEMLSKNNCAEITVCDRGAGVPSGHERHIFEKFYRGENDLSSGIQGSGLGLTIAKQIADAHQGSLTYQPGDQGGSCFTLRLPLIESNEY